MWNKTTKTRVGGAVVLFALSAVVIWSGCECRQAFSPGITIAGVSEPEENPPEQVVEPAENGPAEPAPQPPQENRQPEEERPDPAAAWNNLLEQALQHLRQDELDEARQDLARLDQSELTPSAEQTEQLATVRAELQGRLAERELGLAVQMLASPKREEVRQAQERIFTRPEQALPLLRKAVHDEDPLVVRNALEMLRLLRREEETLPIMVAVLRRAKQEANWADAIREIQLSAAPGAGSPLLKLALSAELPEQRVAALAALSRVVDPPRETVTALVPLILGDGPELASALRAAGHALVINHQHALLTGRGVDEPLSAEQLEQLGALPARLEEIIARDDADSPGEASQAAKMLAVGLRLVPGEPLPGVKVLAFAAEQDTSRAAAVLDGEWNTVDQTRMWRYPVKHPGSIVLDLGRQCTVVGVRIWNLNEAGGMHRGWKEVAVYVAESTSALQTPVATGIVPQAPGKADQADYSTVVPLNFIRGRYVRLQAEGVWRQDQNSGLTEVEVLGF